ncbi:MAG: hypothetical protein ACR2GY_04035 [Phycisphaerales bacterium]
MIVTASLLTFAPPILLSVCHAQDLGQPDVAELQRVENAFEIYGFARSIDTTDDQVIRDLKRHLPGDPMESPGAVGSLFDGLVWGSEDGFMMQYVNFRSTPTVSTFEFFFVDDRPDFPLGTQVVGTWKDLGWQGTGWDRIEIESAPFGTALGPRLRTMQMIFDFTVDASGAFRTEFADWDVKLNEDVSNELVPLLRASKGQYEAALWIRQLEGDNNSVENEWTLVRKDLGRGNAWVARVRSRQIDAGKFSLPAVPQAVPKCLVGFGEPERLSYTDLSNKGDWTGTTEEVRFERDDAAPERDTSARIAARLVLVAAIGSAVFLRLKSFPRKELE